MFQTRISKVFLIVLSALITPVIATGSSLLASPSVSVSTGNQAQNQGLVSASGAPQPSEGQGSVGGGQLAVLSAPSPTPGPDEALDGAEVLWDTWGVPHIYGNDARGLFYAFGWSQMQSHGNLLLHLYGEARGRAAEYWGAQYLPSDRLVRTLGVPTRAETWYAAQSPAFRGYLDAFAAGINAYAREHPTALDADVTAVLPVRGSDVLAHVHRVLLQFSSVAARQPAPGGIDAPAGGSNAWAVAPSRTEGGHALLLANPHFWLRGRLLFYEAHLVGGGVDAYGATFVGFPVLFVAFNDRLGWTHTVNTLDGWDTYQLTPAGDGYLWDGQVQAFATERQTVVVREEDGSRREEQLVVRRSVHGPIVGEKDGKPVALRVVSLDRPGALEQWWDMARATSLSEFEAALQRLQIPLFTVLYADADGHILHLFNGLVPVRPSGTWQDWAGFIPGDTSATLWTTTHPYADLPRVLDPPSGWLQNANDPPWTTTFPAALDPQAFPPYLAPRYMSLRAQRSARLLLDAGALSLRRLVQLKHSTHMELADRVLDDLVRAAREQGSALARQAADVLAAWDRAADPDSRGAVLFANWVWALNPDEGPAPDPFATPWSVEAPLTTPKGLADPTAAVGALERAAEQVQAKYGALDVPWGAVARLRAGALDLPANGGPGDPFGIFRVVDYAPGDDDRFHAVFGDSYVAVIEFANPVRAMVLNGYGNASQPGSPHRADQLDLFAHKQLRPVWRGRAEIEAHLETREVIAPLPRTASNGQNGTAAASPRG